MRFAPWGSSRQASGEGASSSLSQRIALGILVAIALMYGAAKWLGEEPRHDHSSHDHEHSESALLPGTKREVVASGTTQSDESWKLIRYVSETGLRCVDIRIEAPRSISGACFHPHRRELEWARVGSEQGVFAFGYLPRGARREVRLETQAGKYEVRADKNGLFVVELPSFPTTIAFSLEDGELVSEAVRARPTPGE